MFCQSCGSANADDARFCNQCGGSIASPGAPGGPIADAAPAAAPAAGPAAGPAPTAAPAPTAPPAPTAAAPAAAAHVPCPACGAAVPKGFRYCGACAHDMAAPAGTSPARASTNGPVATAPNASPTMGGAPSPFGGPSMMGVSLTGIGVRSPGRVWLTVGILAAALVGAGALGAYLFTARGSGNPGGEAKPSDPFVIGTPLPTTHAPDVDFVSGRPGGGATAQAAGHGTGGAKGGAKDTHPPEHAQGTSGSHAGGSEGPTHIGAAGVHDGHVSGAQGVHTTGGHATGGGGHGHAGATSGGTGGHAGATSGGTGGSGGGASGGTGGSGGGASGGTGGSGGGASGGTGGSGGGASGGTGGQVPDQRDIGGELYGARVHYVVNRYYAHRAQTCFDHATRNVPSVTGTVVVSLTIGADGGVTHTSVARNTTGDEALGRCLAAQVQSWRLPPPPGGSIQMQMPFSR